MSNKDTPNNDQFKEVEHLIPTTKEEWNLFCATFANQIYKTIDDVNQMMRVASSDGGYSPPMGQDYMRDVNINTVIPTQAELTTWLQNPSTHSIQLRGVSQYLNGAIMQYKRTTDHFAKILTFRYDLRTVSEITSENKKTWKSGWNRCLEFLKKLNITYQFQNVMQKAVEEGGIFTYVNNSKNDVTLIEIPSDYCYITGRSPFGWVYAIDLSYFDRYLGSQLSIPELSLYYERFIEARRAGISGKALAPFQYYFVPMEKGFVFTFNSLRAEITPPFQGVFKDALSILDYKALQKQRTTLDTWKIIAQEIPKDKENKPAIDAKIAGLVVQAVQSILPAGVKTFATPFETKELSFNKAQNQDNINGIGEQSFWRTVGVNGTIMDLGDKSAASLRYGLMNDGGFCDHLYRQFENFVNIQLFYVCSKVVNFKVKFYGNRYTEQEDIKEYANLVRSVNFPVGKLFGLAGFEPFEINGVLDQEKELGLKEKMEPIVSAFNTKGNDGGRPKKDVGELSQGGETQRDYDTNKTDLKS